MSDIESMSRWVSMAKMIDEIDKPESRLKPRFLARQLRCNGVGEVIDFSATGLRVQYKKLPRWKVGDEVELTLESAKESHCGSAIARRIVKIGFRRFEVGFEFIDPDAVKKMQLFRCGYDPLEDGSWSAA